MGTKKQLVMVQPLRPGAVLPAHATLGAAGADVRACIPEEHDTLYAIRADGALDFRGAFPTHIFARHASEHGRGACSRCYRSREAHKPAIVLRPGERKLIPTGLRFEIPEGFELQVRPRSGLAGRHGVTLSNSPGTIDADYRGELCVAMINLDPKEPYIVISGDRVAQLVLAPVVRAAYLQGEVQVDTARGEAGFGSTGK